MIYFKLRIIFNIKLDKILNFIKMSSYKMNPVVINSLKDIFNIDWDNYKESKNYNKVSNKYRGQKKGTILFYYGIFLDIFLLEYIKNNNLEDSIDKRKFNFDENLIKFFTLLTNISNERNTSLLLQGNFFYYTDCMRLFELCLVNKNKVYFQDLTRYNFTEDAKLQKKLEYELAKNLTDLHNYQSDDN